MYLPVALLRTTRTLVYKDVEAFTRSSEPSLSNKTSSLVQTALLPASPYCELQEREKLMSEGSSSDVISKVTSTTVPAQILISVTHNAVNSGVDYYTSLTFYVNNAKHQLLNLGCIYKIKHQSPPTFNTLQPYQCSWASYTPVINNVDVAKYSGIALSIRHNIYS